MDLTVESASGPVRVRDRLPDGWTVAGGAVTTEEVAGTTYVGADAPAAAGETVKTTERFEGSWVAIRPIHRLERLTRAEAQDLIIWSPILISWRLHMCSVAVVRRSITFSVT